MCKAGVGTEAGGANYDLERKHMFFVYQRFIHFLPVSSLCFSTSRHRHWTLTCQMGDPAYIISPSLSQVFCPSIRLIKNYTYFILEEAQLTCFSQTSPCPDEVPKREKYFLDDHRQGENKHILRKWKLAVIAQAKTGPRPNVTAPLLLSHRLLR